MNILYYKGPLNDENEKRAVSILLERCKELLSKYREPTEEELANDSVVAQNAILLKKCEQAILNNAITVLSSKNSLQKKKKNKKPKKKSGNKTPSS
jgi:hypothetical protein